MHISGFIIEWFFGLHYLKKKKNVLLVIICWNMFLWNNFPFLLMPLRILDNVSQKQYKLFRHWFCKLTFHLASFWYVITISYFSLISCITLKYDFKASWIHFAYNLQVKIKYCFFVAIWRCIFKCAIKTEGYIIGLCISLWWAMQHYFILQWSETCLCCLMKSMTSWQKRAYRSVYMSFIPGVSSRLKLYWTSWQSKNFFKHPFFWPYVNF